MQIPINIEVLKSAYAMTEDEARHIIEQTKTMRINEGAPIEPGQKIDGFTWKRTDQRIIVEAPANLPADPLIIDLIDADGRTITLAYDPKTGKFRKRVPDPEPAASAPTSPQADPGRDLELALQIGSKAALNVFLKHHPEGLYADLAKAKLEAMP